MKLIIKIFVFLFSFYFISCENEKMHSIINPSESVFHVEAEGGQVEIFFDNGIWEIEQVINLIYKGKINGNAYNLEGKMLRENYFLSLSGLGKLESFWQNKGFIITRNSDNSLLVNMLENGSGENFDFAIVLKSGNETKEIAIYQKKSQGYKFESIEYFLNEGDGDSIFIRNGTTFQFNIQTLTNIKIYPFTGEYGEKKSYFSSLQDDAFVWTESDSLMVKAPSDIWNNKLIFNNGKVLYSSNITKRPFDFINVELSVDVTPSTKQIYTEIQFRERKLSYTLNLINNRTQEKKIIQGKWIEIAPTGKTEVIYN